MKNHQPPAARLVIVELPQMFGAPVVVPKVEHHHVRCAELLVGRPLPGIGYANAGELSKQSRPFFLPGGIVMLAGAVVLFAGGERDGHGPWLPTGVRFLGAVWPKN